MQQSLLKMHANFKQILIICYIFNYFYIHSKLTMETKIFPAAFSDSAGVVPKQNERNIPTTLVAACITPR